MRGHDITLREKPAAAVLSAESHQVNPRMKPTLTLLTALLLSPRDPCRGDYAEQALARGNAAVRYGGGVFPGGAWRKSPGLSVRRQIGRNTHRVHVLGHC